MFQDTIPTTFGAAFTMLPTSMVDLPRDAARSDQDHQHPEGVPILQLRVPPQLLMDGPTDAANFIRLGCLQAGEARIGIAMAYSPGHFAMAVYDHGSPLAKAMSQATLEAGQMMLMLRSDDSSRLVESRLTTLMRGVLTNCRGAAPCSFDVFADAIAGISRALCQTDAYREIGIDPHELQTVTLSVCISGHGQPTDLKVISLSKVH